MDKLNLLKEEIINKSKEYVNLKLSQETHSFEPGETRVNYAGRVYDEQEMANLIDSALEFWLTSGRYAEKFEADLAAFLGVKFSLLVNSGSSANLLAFMALTSPLLKERQLKRGDEVITLAAGFPTTVTPIIQFGAIPVFVDVSIPSYNIDISKLSQALTPKTKAIMVAHTLGNPFEAEKVAAFCKEHNLWLIEDNCDALGSKINGQFTGTVGDIGTSSFYPPHHMTMGEGGAVYTNNPLLKKILLSMRDWGRDCWCPSGKDNTCGCRFDKQYGKLPLGYDHKYVYSHLGYNLKATDLQASIGCAQLVKLPSFIKARQENFKILHNGLKPLKDILILPQATENSEPSWFGFMLTLKDTAIFSRNDLVNHLESRNIQTRNLFAGNLTYHPCFTELNEGIDYRVCGELTNTNTIMNRSFWVGLYPGMSKEKLCFMTSEITSFCKQQG